MWGRMPYNSYLLCSGRGVQPLPSNAQLRIVRNDELVAALLQRHDDAFEHAQGVFAS